LYEAQGDLARAQPLLEQALEIVKNALPARHPYIAACLTSLANLYRAQGNLAGAQPLLEQALEIDKKALLAGHPHIVVVLNSLALLFQAQGDLAGAQRLFEQSLENRKKALPAGHPAIATGLNNLAQVYEAQGDLARALPLYEQVLEIREKALPGGHPDIAHGLMNLAVLYQERGDPIRAEALSKSGLEMLRRAYEQSSVAVGERTRLALLGELRGALGLQLSLAQGNGGQSNAIFGYVLDWKGAATTRADDERLVHDRPELRTTLDELRGIRGRLARMSLTVSPTGRPDAWRAEFEKLRDRKEKLEADLSRRSAAFRDGMRKPAVDPSDIAAVLPVRTALIDLCVYDHFSPPVGGKSGHVVEQRILAFVVRRDRPVICLPLGPVAPVDRAVRAWLQGRANRQTEAWWTKLPKRSRDMSGNPCATLSRMPKAC
jgi:tetratricopeptide (TPR) repeat protein